MAYRNIRVSVVIVMFVAAATTAGLAGFVFGDWVGYKVGCDDGFTAGIAKAKNRPPTVQETNAAAVSLVVQDCERRLGLAEERAAEAIRKKNRVEAYSQALVAMRCTLLAEGVAALVPPDKRPTSLPYLRQRSTALRAKCPPPPEFAAAAAK